MSSTPGLVYYFMACKVNSRFNNVKECRHYTIIAALGVVIVAGTCKIHYIDVVIM
ncbi:hypothetical protein MHBO_005043 [Bonamia ostreae]|uniref:Uncharacterized protein n=1 Tax=Bonamia ostreae TaxID=126728 RepID=A0ABV2AVW2_9EUKA